MIWSDADDPNKGEEQISKAGGAPFGLPSLAVLDKVEGLEGAERLQQLPALILVQVVGQAAHKHTVRRVHATRLPRELPRALAARLQPEAIGVGQTLPASLEVWEASCSAPKGSERAGRPSAPLDTRQRFVERRALPGRAGSAGRQRLSHHV